MGKRSELGTVVCEFCDREVQKVHPWQIICGAHGCRLASKRKHYGATFTCDACGEEAQRKRSNQRFCPLPACQAVSKKGKRVPKVELACPYCERTVDRRNSRQVTCGSAECKMKRGKMMLRNRDPLRRTGKRVKCTFCKEKFTKLSSIHVTCNKPECAKRQKKARADVRFKLERRRKPLLCLVCDRPIRVKRFRKHPACSRQEAADKKRLSREKKKKLTAQKASAFKNSNPKTRSRTSPRMEELKCVRQLQIHSDEGRDRPSSPR